MNVQSKYNIKSPDDYLIDWDFYTYDEGGNITIYVDGNKCYSTSIAEQPSIGLSANDLGLKNLTYKTYTVNTVYSGDNINNGFNHTDTFKGTWGFYVDIATFHWEEEDNLPRAYGDNISFIITLNDATGNVNYYINGKKFTISADELKRNYYEEYYDYHLQISYDEFKVGENNITFTYEGDDYPSDTFELDLELNPRIHVDNRYSSYDDPATVILILPSDAKGNLNVYDVEVDYDTGYIVSYNLIGSSPVKDHIAAVPLYNLSLGYHNIYANYTGDDYPVSTGHYDWDDVYRPKIEIQPKIEVPKRIYEQNKYNITITMPEAYEGTLTVTLGDKERSVNVKNGKGSIELFNLESINKEEYFEYPALEGHLNFENDEYTYSIDFTIYVSDINPKFTPEIILDQDECLKGDTYYTYSIANLPNDIEGYMDIYIDGIYYDNIYIIENPGLDVSKLDLGEHTMTFNYTGDEYYLPFLAEAKFNVTDCLIYIDYEAIIGDYHNWTVGGNSIAINSLYDYGYYTLIIDGEITDMDAMDSRAVLALENLTYGNHEVEVIYKNSKTQKIEKQTVKARYAIISDWEYEDINEKESKTLTFIVPSHIKGNLIVSVDKNYTAPIVDGIATLTVSNLEKGYYEVNVRYDGDEYPELTDNSRSIIVYTPSDDGRQGTFTDSENYLKYGDEIIIYANYSSGLTGTLKVYDNEKSEYALLGEAKIEDGKATLKLNNLPYGDHNILAYITDYDEENYYFDEVVFDEYFHIRPLINGSIDTPIDSITLGESVELTVELEKDANGIIYLTADKFGENIVGQFNVLNGKATVRFTPNQLAENWYYIKYDDDKYHLLGEAALLHVYPNVTYPEKMVEKSDEYLTVNLPSYANGNLKVFGINTTVKNGKAEISLSNLSVGNHIIDLVYTGDKISGDFYYEVDEGIEVKYIKVVKPESDIKVTKTDGSLNVKLNEDAAGYIILKIEDKFYPELLKDGSATITGLDMTLAENVTISYTGDEKYIYISKKSVKADEIIKQDANLTFEADDINVGDIAVISIELNENATGVVLIQIEGQNITSEIINGKATATIAELKAGTYDVTVTYRGDENVIEDVKTATFTVNKIPAPEIIINAPESEVEKSSIIIEVTVENATGNITVNGKTLALENSKATATIENLTVGELLIEIFYTGDEKYLNATATKTVNVFSKKDAELNADDVNIYIGDTAKITITINKDITDGLTVNGQKAEITNGTAEYEIADLSEGNHTVIISFEGNKYFNADEKTVKVKVSKVAYDENKTNPFEDNETKDSKNPTYSINLPADATGNLTVTIANKTYTKELVNGSASIEVTDLPVGEYDVTVSYTGDAKYAPITKTTKASVKVDPKIVAKDLTVQYYAGKYYSVTVYGDDAKPAANEKVTFTLNGKKITTVTTNENGTAKFKVTQTPVTKGKLVIEALGIKVTKKLTVKRVIVLKSVTVKKSAKKLILQATLKKVNGKYLKGKKITFKFNGKKYTAKTDKKGIAKVTIKSSVLKKLKVGKKVTYQATYVKDTVKKTVKVKR